MTVLSKRQRRDVVLKKTKKKAIDHPDYETEKKLLTMAENPKETSLFQALGGSRFCKVEEA